MKTAAICGLVVSASIAVRLLVPATGQTAPNDGASAGTLAWTPGLHNAGIGSICPPQSDLADVYRSVRRAAVEILVDGHHSGSGCFVSADGRVATAAHVIADPDRKIEVLTEDDSRLLARIIAVDLGHDIIILQVDQQQAYPFLQLAERMPPPGASVMICSSAAYRRVLLQPGMIARDNLTFEYQDHFVEVTQVAALIQEGTSGGAWINTQGELIGIQSGSVTVKGNPAGIANVAPSTAVRQLLQSDRNAASTTIGAFVDEIWLLSRDELRRYPSGCEGVVVQAVNPDGPAARAEILKGDVIIACQGKPFRFRDDFVRSFRQRNPGDAIELTVLRPDGAGVRNVSVQLGRLEVGWPEAKPSPENDPERT
ncbi:MAG: S1C family serine protease [Planctomycetes bacterium]|nr:S1C family serine protease [Planctomycetota bacterium]